MATEPSQTSIAVSKRLGELLVEVGLIKADQFAEALDLQKRMGGKLGSILIQKGYIEERVLLEFLGKQCGIRYVSLSSAGRIPEDVIGSVPENIARRHNLIAIHKKNNVLTVAMADPLNVLVLDDLKMMSGLEVQPVLSSEVEILAAINQYYKSQSSQEALDEILKKTSTPGEEAKVDVVEDKVEEEAGENILTLGSKGEDAPIIQLVNLILSSAIKSKASDIHIEPYPKDLRVRFRIDGVLHEQPSPPKKFQNAIASRIKIMANLDIAERRVPQDGRIRLKVNNNEIDLRVSVLPCAVGEKVVLRILDSSGLKVKLEDLGFEPEALAVYQKHVHAPHGIILITGPTGSGKSTTLYSTLSQLNQPDVN
ncbi:MAG: Flp pilus assembly complex ATPase component TadA, partial [Elusimicrobia bacterium]|nr:Flp pilus assembly complex ATPase component TadA [Elusimicrobiota bacterium]